MLVVCHHQGRLREGIFCVLFPAARAAVRRAGFFELCKACFAVRINLVIPLALVELVLKSEAESAGSVTIFFRCQTILDLLPVDVFAPQMFE